MVDDHPAIRKLLKELLQEHNYKVNDAAHPTEALEIIGRGERIDLILSDIIMPYEEEPLDPEAGFKFRQRVQEDHPGIPFVLFTSSNIDECIELAIEHDVGNILAKPIERNELLNSVRRWISGKAVFGLSHYLHDARIETLDITNTSDIMQAIDTIQEALGPRDVGRDLHLRLAIEEMITDAVYHGNMIKKHKQNVELMPEQEVRIEYGQNSEAVGVAINDQGGLLTKTIVLNSINNCLTKKSLRTMGGRGWFLTRGFIDRLIINIKRGKRTEVILVQYFDQKWRKQPKPFLINEL